MSKSGCLSVENPILESGFKKKKSCFLRMQETHVFVEVQVYSPDVEIDKLTSQS